MAETKGTIVCRLCGDSIEVEFNRAEGNGLKLAVSDLRPLAEHYAECRAMANTPALPRGELAGRVDRLLAIVEEAGHLTRGDRACTMCGGTNEACLRSLNRGKSRLKRDRRPGKACCPACGVGNTHPTGKESVTCAEWGRENGAQS